MYPFFHKSRKRHRTSVKGRSRRNSKKEYIIPFGWYSIANPNLINFRFYWEAKWNQQDVEKKERDKMRINPRGRFRIQKKAEMVFNLDTLHTKIVDWEFVGEK